MIKQIVKDYMFTEYKGYSLVGETNDSLTFTYDIDAVSPSCSMAGCLFLLGILPGVIYYFLVKRNAEHYSISILVKKDSVVVSGTSPSIYKIQERLNSMIRKSVPIEKTKDLKT